MRAWAQVHFLLLMYDFAMASLDPCKGEARVWEAIIDICWSLPVPWLALDIMQARAKSPCESVTETILWSGLDLCS